MPTPRKYKFNQDLHELHYLFQIKKTYEQQLKVLQGKISDLESESKRREREISEHQALSDKINQLQKSLEEAKSQVSACDYCSFW